MYTIYKRKPFKAFYCWTSPNESENVVPLEDELGTYEEQFNTFGALYALIQTDEVEACVECVSDDWELLHTHLQNLKDEGEIDIHDEEYDPKNWGIYSYKPPTKFSDAMILLDYSEYLELKQRWDENSKENYGKDKF